MHARSLLLALVGLFVASASTVQAFGAGNIPTVAFYEGKAFRHGDIEDILTGMAKKAGGGFLGIGSGTKFSPLDLKRVYFGNWLRDYSQAIDIGTLKKTNYQTIVNLLMALGFMTFGYVSEEFEITEGRLGCYLPVEHIDNPKGYGEGQDPRQFYPGLRPPVDPRELQIDPQTGMKAYIAMEGHGWDTSKACIRRTIERCIHHGRLHRSTGRTEDEYEAYRLLGQAMHTLEDFPAHSNFCELALIKLGYTHVFPHVGQNARIKAPNGAMVPPLVTGTFGGSDFIHSLLGEAGDHLSEASISDLNKAVSRARSDPNNSDGGLVGLLRQIPGGDGEQASRDINEIRAAGGAGGDPNSMSPQQLHETLWKILVFRDKVMKGVETTIDRIPGLGALIEKITSSINVFIFSTIEPYLGPVLKQATGGLNNLSEEVINNPEQFAVFDNPNSDDPTHSFLSKDHFGLILNEPAGNLAKIIIRPAIKAVVEAWEDPTIDPRAVAERACEALFHPSFGTGRSQVQQEMLDYMHQWIESQGSHKQEVLNRLTAAKVRSNDNRRIGDTSSVAHSHDHHAGGVPSQGLQGVLATHNVHVPGAQYLNMGQDLLQGKMPGSVGFGSSQGQGRWRDMETSTAGGGGGSSGGGGYDSAPPPPAVQHAAAYGQPQHQHQPYQQQYQQPTSYGQPALQQQQHYQQHPQSSYGQPPPPPPSYGQQPHSYQAPPPQPSYGGGPPGGFSGSSSSGGGGGYPGQDHHGGRHPHQPLGGGDDFGRARPGEATDQWGNPILPPSHSSGESGHHRQEHGGGGGYHGGGGGYYGGDGGRGGY